MSSIATSTAPSVRIHRDRVFYTAMAAIMAVTVFAGFAPTYFLKGYFGTPALPALVHVHGVAFTAWLLLFFTQTVLIAGRQTEVHRKLGYAGAGLAVFLVVIGVVTAIAALRAGRTPPGLDPRSFLVLPLGDITTFAVFVVFGVAWRNSPQAHKRLMLLATIAMLDAAIARLPGVFALGPLGFFGLQDLFIVACVAYDFASRRRVHPVYIWGGLFIVVMQPLRLFMSQTPLWLAFGDWLKG